MAAVRIVKPKATYLEWFKELINFITPPYEAEAKSIHIIMDNYMEMSVKEGTRRKRGAEKGPRVVVSGYQQFMPKGEAWQSFLGNGDNKNDLVRMFVQFLKSDSGKTCLKLDTVITGNEKCWNLSNDSIKPYQICNHEEADSVLHAAKVCEHVVVVAKDTDVMVLLISNFNAFCSTKQWFMKIDSQKYVNIGKIVDHIGEKVANSLSKFHCLTGCDTTSYFYKVGKIAPPFKKVMKDKSKLTLTSALGRNKTLPSEEIQNCMKFVQLIMYSGKENESYVECRVRLYNQQKQKSSTTLPPDSNSCELASLRSHYQSYFWSHCTEASISPLEIEKYGWKYDHEEKLLKPIWYTASQLPLSLQRSKKGKIVSNGYEADVDESFIEPTRKKARTVSIERPIGRSSLKESEKEDELREEGTCSTENEFISYSDDDWEHYSDFEFSDDSSDSEWLP